MKKIFLFIAILLGLLSVPLFAQGPNMSKYITLTVKNGQAIKLDFKANSSNTPVRIVSGSNTQDIVVGTEWYNSATPSTYTVNSEGTTMTVYGDLTAFSCSHNEESVTAVYTNKNPQLTSLFCNNNSLTYLHLINNKELKELVCYNNPFSTETVNNIYCSLPTIQGATGKCHTLNTGYDNNHATVVAATSDIARQKNWDVQYYNNGIPQQNNIPNNGNYVCGEAPANLDKLITLTVKNGEAIKLDFKAKTTGSRIRIESGNNVQNITVGTTWYNGNPTSTYTIPANGNLISIYGDLAALKCSENQNNLTEINTSDLPKLEELYCDNNNINTIDLSKNIELVTLLCNNNALKSLNLKNNSKLRTVTCYNNQFTKASLNDIYCSLPVIPSTESNAVFYPINTTADINHAELVDAASQNARAKNWNVKYYSNGEVANQNNIPEGTAYACQGTEPNMNRFIALTVLDRREIKINLKANKADTPIRLVSGNTIRNIVVGTDWYSAENNYTFTSDGTFLTIYGDVSGLNVSDNKEGLTNVDVSKNAGLSTLICKNNNISSLDLQNNSLLSELVSLDCSKNKIERLNLINSNKLQTLNCSENNLSSIKLNGANLKEINVSKNALTELNLSNTTQLTKVFCNNNSLTSLDLKQSPNLKEIDASNNNIVSFAIATLNNIETLNCSKNNIDNLNLGYSTNLKRVECDSNSINSITIDNTKKLEYLSCKSNKINSLSLEDTPNLIELNCSKNRIKKLILLNATKLENLFCNNNYIDTINITSSTILKELNCSDNKIKEIDLSVATLLLKLECSNNQLEKLTLHNSTQLTSFNCSKNKLKQLDLTQNTALTDLICSNNDITSIVLPAESNIKNINCSFNSLKTLSTTAHKNLETINCAKNKIEKFNFSENTKLKEIICYNNPLTTLETNNLYCSLPDIEGGTATCYTVNNVNDTKHADIIHATSNNARSKKWNVKYYNNGVAPQGHVPNNGTYPCGDYNANKYVVLYVQSGKDIKIDLKSAQKNTPVYIENNKSNVKITVNDTWYSEDNKKRLAINAESTTIKIYGDISGINISENLANLTAINLDNNTDIVELNCDSNEITSLTLSSVTKLEKLNCKFNKLTTLNVSNNTELTELICDNNTLEELDLAKNTKLAKLVCNNNKLKSLPLIKNVALTYINCDNNKITELNLSTNVILEELYCRSNDIANINLVANTQLKKLYCNSNKIKKLDISNSNLLTHINCGYNNIDNISLVGKEALVELYCNNNKLTDLDISRNDKLQLIRLDNNKFSKNLINDIYCSLKDRSKESKGVLFPSNTKQDNEYSIIEATNSDNARAKNWDVKFFANGEVNKQTDIPSNGTYPCNTANKKKSITLYVNKNIPLKIDFKAANNNTPIRIESGNHFENVTAGTDWYSQSINNNTPIIFTAPAQKVIIYGDIVAINCSDNENNLYGIEFTTNTDVTYLDCSENEIPNPNVHKLPNLTYLNCSNNQIINLDLSYNQKLESLYCDNNRIGELDLEKQQLLSILSCSNNQLKNLDLSNNRNLTHLECFNNLFTAEALNKLYCTLPMRTKYVKGICYPIYTQDEPDYVKLEKATSDNARDKFWDVQFYRSKTIDEINVPNNGAYLCNPPDVTKYITLSVKSNGSINIKLKSDDVKVPVKITSGDQTTDYFISTSWNQEAITVKANTDKIIIYGNVVAIDCSNNGEKLTGVDLSNNTAVTELIANGNSIASINLDANTELKGLNLANNKLEVLDIRNNTKLDYLYCNDNQLTNLDLSNNTIITRVWCYNNKLNTEAVNNLYCSLPTVTGASGSIYTLNTIPADITSEEHAIYQGVLAATSNNARIKNWLVQFYNNGNYANQENIPSNGEYQCKTTPPNMTKVISLNVVKDNVIKFNVKANQSNTQIRIVNGNDTEDYIFGTDWKEVTLTSKATAVMIYGNAVALDCSGNKAQLTGVDLRNNKDVTVLNCSDNAINTLDLSQNTALEELYCNDTKIDKINLKHNPNITKLFVNNNNLSEIDLSENTKLKNIEIKNNKLTSLDLSKNNNVLYLDCSRNMIADLNLSNAVALEDLYCNSNKLVTIDLSHAPKLETINCADNKLIGVDFSENNSLTTIICYNNQLRTEAINEMYCSLPTIPNGYQGNCYPINTIPANDAPEYDNYLAIVAATSDNARSKNWKVQYYNNNAKDKDNVKSSGNYACSNLIPNLEKSIALNVAEGKSIKMNFKAAKDNTPVRIISKSIAKDIIVGAKWTDKPFEFVSENNMIIIYGDVTDFDCANNGENLTEINSKKNLDLTGLVCDNNNIKSLDLTLNTKLERLSCANNKLKALNVINNIRLTELDCSDNTISELNIKENSLLTKLIVRNNQIKSLTLTENFRLQTLDCSANSIENIDLANNANLMNLNCANNHIKAINISKNTNLADLNCSNNKLTALSLSTNTQLKKVACFNNPFTTNVVNELYCSLPTIEGIPSVIYTLNTEADENHAQIVAATSKNARDKNWIVKYYNNADASQNDIPNNGTFVCASDPANMNRFITLTVDTNKAIKLNFKADAANTQVLLASGDKIEKLTVGTEWYAETEAYTFTSVGNTLTIYGNISEFNCQDNDSNVTAINIRNNAQLTTLSCANNNISTIDISQNMALTKLNCASNAIKALDLTNNTKLVKLSCYNNPFTTDAMNQLYCSMPTIMGDAGTCYALDTIPDSASTNFPVYQAIVAATSDNAREKNWKVLFKTTQEDIPSNGEYNCNTGVDESFVSGISVFPNPATSKVQVQLDESVNEALILVDLYGRALLTADVVAGRANFDVSNLTAGTYFIRVGNITKKLTVK